MHFSDITRPLQQIANLLSLHTISRLNGVPLLCSMSDPGIGGRVQVSLAIPGQSSPTQS
jgi:hypothetical protein